MAARKSTRKYGATAGRKVKKVMEEMEAGTLRSGGSGQRVTSRKQAIAIGLSEARKAGGKVPSKKPASKKPSVAKKGTGSNAKKRTARAPKKKAA